MKRVDWRFAVWAGAVLGGVVWAVLAVLLLTEVGDGGRSFPLGVWTPAIVASAPLLGFGIFLSWRGRSTVARSRGVALVTAASIGWLVLGVDLVVARG